MPREARSAAVGRRLVADALDVWALPRLRDVAALVVTELVANAAEHARGDTVGIAVTRTATGHVRIAVADLDPTRPRPRPAGPADERGRGLPLIDALTHRWGVDVLPGGKRVWAECAPDAS